MALSFTNPEYFLEFKLRRFPGSVEKVRPERLRRKRLLVWRRISHCKSGDAIAVDIFGEEELESVGEGMEGGGK